MIKTNSIRILMNFRMVLLQDEAINNALTYVTRLIFLIHNNHENTFPEHA